MTATAQRLLTTPPKSRRLFDLAITVAVLAGSLALISHGGVAPTRPGREEFDLIGILLVAGSTVPLIVWRRYPLSVFTTTATAGTALAGLGYPLDLMLGPTVALYLLSASREPQAPWTWRTTATVMAMLMAYLAATAAAHRAVPGIELLHTGLAWAVAWFAGERTRLRREQITELRERAHQAERDRERERLLAVAEERARIARDLHDSAGHAINVIGVRAGAARMRHHQDPDRSLRALEAIEEVARQTVEEIDHIVATLRQGGPANPVEAPIGLASLNTLIGHHAAAGLEVRLDTSGPPRQLGPVVDQTAYRILQEALTNAARHGTGSAQIDLSFGDTAVEAIITNPMPAASSPPTEGGHGLIGMTERAALLGGSLDAERVDGLFRVMARIPYGDHPN
ncbi:MAG: sensor histidine kinase [Acidimicrobiia bacterium]